MGTRILDIGVLLAAVLSAALVGLLLLTPALPQPSAFPPLPSTTPRPPSSVPPEGDAPPIGLYLLRGPFSFGPCLAIELSPESYPTAEGAVGTATATYWERGMTGCDTRTGELRTAPADVHRVADEDDATAPPVGYAVQFRIPLLGAGVPGDETETVVAELTILVRRSSDTVLQAIETAPGSGQGYVLDLVPGIDPPLDPLPTPTAAAGESGPLGLFLMQGPIIEDVCLAIELTDDAYPSDSSRDGLATIRSWNHAGADPDDPARCLSRRGEITTVGVPVVPVLERGRAVSWAVVFPSPVPLDTPGGELGFAILADRSNADRLVAVMVSPDDGTELILDRVDELDPPLVTGP